MPHMPYEGIPAACWVDVGEQSIAIAGVLVGRPIEIFTGEDPLPQDRLVTVHANDRQWVGWLTDEQLWSDGTLSYTLRL